MAMAVAAGGEVLDHGDLTVAADLRKRADRLMSKVTTEHMLFSISAVSLHPFPGRRVSHSTCHPQRGTERKSDHVDLLYLS